MEASMLTLLTLAAVVVFALLLAAFIFGWGIGHVGRDKLRSDLTEALREIGILKEAKASAETLADEREEKYQDMRRIAGEALKIAHKQEFPVPPKQHQSLDRQFDFDRVKPNIILPKSKNCPQCFVSVRSEAWPTECPACHSVFGFSEG